MNKDIQDRRPVSSRNTRWAEAIARRLQRVGATPNGISVASMVFALLAALCFAFAFGPTGTGRTQLCMAGAIIGIQGRLLCNLFDGMVAVEGKMRSAVGALYNDMPDRISDSLILIGLGCGLTALPSGPVLGLLAALLAMMTAYIRLLGGSCGIAQTFNGPMAKQHRMAILTLASLVTLVLPQWGQTVLSIALWVIIIGTLVTCVRRIRLIAKALRAGSATDV